MKHKHIIHYPNRQKEMEQTLTDGILDGLFTMWYDDGQKKYEGNYKDGKEDGLWSYYTEIGNGKYKVMYTDGTHNMALFTDNLGTDYTGSPIVEGVPLQDDTYLYQKNDYKAYDKKEEYDFSHFPRFFGTFKDEKEDGLWTVWYENGKKRSEKTYKDGKEDGLVTLWYENGQTKEILNFKDGKEHGKWKLWVLFELLDGLIKGSPMPKPHIVEGWSGLTRQAGVFLYVFLRFLVFVF